MTHRGPRLGSLAGCLLLLGAAGCSGDDDDGPPLPEDCPDEDIFEATACDETYCGGPEVEVGVGPNGFFPVVDGDEVGIWFGTQGGYHIEVAAEMTNLCPIVFLRPELWLDPGDGSELVPLFDVNRHVMAVRVEPTVSPKQQFWGIRGLIPCIYWPDDPEQAVECSDGAGSAGHIEDFDVFLRIEAEDHNGRIATSERRIQPVCCGFPDDEDGDGS